MLAALDGEESPVRVALALLTLLTGGGPLVVLADDAQWHHVADRAGPVAHVPVLTTDHEHDPETSIGIIEVSELIR